MDFLEIKPEKARRIYLKELGLMAHVGVLRPFWGCREELLVKTMNEKGILGPNFDIIQLKTWFSYLHEHAHFRT